MQLTQFFGQLILPPASIIILLLIGVLFCAKRWGKLLLMMGILSLYVLSIELAPLYLSKPLQNQYPAVSEVEWSRADSIVVFSAGVNRSAPEYQGKDGLDGYGLARTAYAYYLYQKTGLPIIISGGLSPGYDHEPSAVVMGRKLMQWGVPRTLIYIDPVAKTTWGNGVLSAQVLREQHLQTPLLVTNAWHMPRSVWSFQQAGVQAIPAPCDFISHDGGWSSFILPKADYFAASCQLLREYLGLIWYQIRYTQKYAATGS